jgi:hypothetical protein
MGGGGTNVDRVQDDLIRAPSFRLEKNLGLNGLIIQNLKYWYRQSRWSVLLLSSIYVIRLKKRSKVISYQRF